MTDPALERRVELTGWSTVLLGAVCLALAALEIVVPRLLGVLAAGMGSDADPSLAATREAFAAGAVPAASINAAFGVALSVVGLGVVRRAHWSHRAMTIAAWSSIVALVAIFGPTVEPLIAMAGGAGAPRAIAVAAGVIAAVAQIALVVLFLRFWRRPEVRALLRRPGPRSGAGG